MLSSGHKPSGPNAVGVRRVLSNGKRVYVHEFKLALVRRCLQPRVSVAAVALEHGVAQVRRTLYMAAVAALRCNPVIRGFYQHLRSQGKPAKVALTACMRKLLIIMNAMLKHHCVWSPALDTQHGC